VNRPGVRLFRLPWRTARQIRADVDDELAFHLTERVDALIALGMSPDDARAQAEREFGDIDDARRYLGAVDRAIEAAQRRSDLMQDLLQDVVYAARKLRSTPAFTLAAVITLALGIGATTAIFSVVNAVLLQTLPFPQADHLVRIRFTQQGHGDAGTPMDLVDYGGQAKNLVGVALAEGTTANIARPDGDAERVIGVHVNANWFDLLRAKPVVGRFFTTGEDRPGGPNVAVLSEQLWRRDFGGDPSIVGKAVRINAEPYTVIGVVPAAMRYPVTAELWTPTRFTSADMSDQSRGARWLAVLARVKDGVPLATADAEVARISEAMEHRFPEDYRERRAHVVTLRDYLVGDMQKPLLVVLGAVVLVLLIACANVANLLLVRATSRESEMAIRTALGAGRGRLLRQLVTESVMLSVIGGVVGLAIAKAGMTLMLGRAPQSLLFVDNASLDGTTLAVTGAVVILTGLLFGTLPARQSMNPELATTLRAGGRGARSQPSAHRAKRAIVIVELALAVMLLTGAGLLLNSLSRLMALDPGFAPNGALAVKVTLPEASYDSTGRRVFARQVEQRVAGLPSVQAVGIADAIPFDGTGNVYSLSVRGQTYTRPSDAPIAEVRSVSPDYFRAIGMPVRLGRGFGATDVANAPHVYVVNEAFVKRVLNGADPLTQAVHLDWGRDPRGSFNAIVGVVADVRGNEADLGSDPLPTVYAAFDQYPKGSVAIVARSSADPANLATPIRSIVRDIDSDLPVYAVQTLDQMVSGSLGRQRFYSTLIAIFAGVALVLAAVGLYGVIAYAVSQRTHELGVRVALGATGDRITRMVIGEGLALTAAGIVLGLIGAFTMGRLVSSLLFGVTPRDPLTLATVVATLAAIATLASWLPARRAARVDPLIAMRGE
jgi:predicted permease